MDIGFVALITYASIVVASNIIVFLMKSYPLLPASREVARAGPLVSIIVPVRNEEDSVKDCVESLRNLEYKRKEIIVVDGDSSDRTPEILSRYSDIRVVQEPPLPQGWVGKNWACWTGYKNSSGGLFLFTDGDTRHSERSLTSTEQCLQENQLDMVTIIPRVVTEGFWEKAILPLVFQAIFFFTGGNRANSPKSSRYMANGQYLLIRREAYEKIGGHDALRSRIDEDIRIAQALKRVGLAFRILLGYEFLETRMYKSFREIWEGWSKNFFAGSNYRKGWFLFGALFVFFFLLLPYLVFGYGVYLWLSSYDTVVLGLGFVMVLALTARVALFNYRWHYYAWFSLAYPLAVAVFLAIMFNSMLAYTTGRGVSWKGRTYRYEAGSLTHN